MKSFLKNKIKSITPKFDNCRWETGNLTHASPDLSDIFSLQPVYPQEEPIFPEKEPKDGLSQLMGQGSAPPVPAPRLPTQEAVSSIPPHSAQDKIETQKSSLQIAEDHLLSKVAIRRLYGGIYLFNGHYYGPLTEQDYLILLRVNPMTASFPY